MIFRARSSAPVRLQRADGTQVLALAASRPLWLVGADLCVFTRIDLGSVAPRFRQQVIAQQARQLAPFAAPGWHAADRGGEVLLWLWDQAVVQAAIAAAGGSGWQVLPEQVHLRATADALLRREYGTTTVLERWRDGRLAFSARLPAGGGDHAAWLRAAGLTIDRTPVPAGIDHDPVRWDRQPADWRAWARDPAVASGACAAAMALWLLWSLGELAASWQATAAAAASVATLERTLAPQLQQRDTALQLALRREALGTLLGGVTAIEAAAEFEHLAGGRYARLLDWRYGNGRMQVTLQDEHPDNRAYVEALEASPWFEKVSVTPAMRPDQISLEILLDGGTDRVPAYVAPAESAG